jgi:phosphotransferase system HPr (HPr) family protein
MYTITAIVKSKYGIHVRPSAAIVKASRKFPKTKIIIYDPESQQSVNTNDLLGILSLSLSFSTKVIIQAIGEEEEKAAKVIANIIETFKISTLEF